MPVKLQSYAYGFTAGAPSTNIDTTGASMVVALCKFGFSGGLTLGGVAMDQIGGSSAMFQTTNIVLGASTAMTASGITLTDYTYIIVLKEANKIVASDRQDVNYSTLDVITRSINTGVGIMALLAFNLYNDNYVATETPGDYVNDHSQDGIDGKWRYRFKRVQASDAATESYQIRINSNERVLTSHVAVGYQQPGFAILI